MKFNFNRIVLSIILAVLIAVFLDVVAIAFGMRIRIVIFCTIILFLLLFFYNIRYIKTRVLSAILFVCCSCIIIVFSLWYFSFKTQVYSDVDLGKSALYFEKKVLVIVPHEDDDLNILSGVFEEFDKYKSNVYVAFITNGDSNGYYEDRINEALHSLELCGVDDDHVIFMGYGDQWAGNHIYNATADELKTSRAGNTSAYALPTHPAYNDGIAYTRQNLLNDLESLISTIQPDYLFYCGCDAHPDHIATALFVEEVLGKMLHNGSLSTDTQVLMGFAYHPSYYGVSDYHEDANVPSSVTSLFWISFRNKHLHME